MLLLSSNLNYFSGFESILTSEFERISAEVLKNYLPKNSVIKEFGKNSSYQGNAKDKINLLAQEMNIEVNKKEVDRILGNQERGLDIIAWVPFEDKNSNMFSILVQCACGKEWYKKQNETRRYETSYFRFYKLNPIHCIFIPYNIVDTNSNLFFQSDEILNTLIFERKRILQYIYRTSFFNSLNSSKIIEYAIKYKEDLL